MTLGQCLDEIRKLYLNGEISAMGTLGMRIIQTLKTDFFLDEELPRNGWFLFFSQDGQLYIVNKNVRLRVFPEEVVIPEIELNYSAESTIPMKNYKNILHVTFPREPQTRNS
ncbi:MAG: hypothetical protein U0T83_06180 [Bacteriovoracaceae bacterium]